jgi:hypothetical protein
VVRRLRTRKPDYVRIVSEIEIITTNDSGIQGYDPRPRTLMEVLDLVTVDSTSVSSTGSTASSDIPPRPRRERLESHSCSSDGD